MRRGEGANRDARRWRMARAILWVLSSRQTRLPSAPRGNIHQHGLHLERRLDVIRSATIAPRMGAFFRKEGPALGDRIDNPTAQDVIHVTSGAAALFGAVVPPSTLVDRWTLSARLCSSSPPGSRRGWARAPAETPGREVQRRAGQGVLQRRPQGRESERESLPGPPSLQATESGRARQNGIRYNC